MSPPAQKRDNVLAAAPRRMRHFLTKCMFCVKISAVIVWSSRSQGTQKIHRFQGPFELVLHFNFPLSILLFGFSLVVLVQDTFQLDFSSSLPASSVIRSYQSSSSSFYHLTKLSKASRAIPTRSWILLLNCSSSSYLSVLKKWSAYRGRTIYLNVHRHLLFKIIISPLHHHNNHDRILPRSHNKSIRKNLKIRFQNNFFFGILFTLPSTGWNHWGVWKWGEARWDERQKECRDVGLPGGGGGYLLGGGVLWERSPPTRYAIKQDPPTPQPAIRPKCRSLCMTNSSAWLPTAAHDLFCGKPVSGSRAPHWWNRRRPLFEAHFQCLNQKSGASRWGRRWMGRRTRWWTRRWARGQSYEAPIEIPIPALGPTGWVAQVGAWGGS